MKNIRFKIIAFVAMLIVPTIAWIGIRLVSPSTYERLDHDLGEKREKTKIESITQLASSGDVLSDYFADRAPFRSVLVSFYQKTNTSLEAPYDNTIKPAILASLYGSSVSEIDDGDSSAFDELFGGNSGHGSANSSGNGGNGSGNSSGTSGDGNGSDNNGSGDSTSGANNGSDDEPHEHNWIYAGGQEASLDSWGFSIYFCDKCHEIEYTDWKNKLVDNSYLAPVVINDMTIVGRNGWLFLYGFGNIDYYKANNILSEQEMNAYMQTLIKLDDMCQDRGIKLAISIAPNKDQVYPEYMPSYMVENEYKRTSQLVDYIKNNSDLAISYSLSELKYCDRYWQTYLKYDTHWNRLGAYIGVQALYGSLGMQATDPLTLNIISYEFGRAGDLIDLGGIDASSYTPDIDYNVFYKEDVTITYETGGYVAIQNIYKTLSTSSNQEKMVLIGDSFRVNMIEYMAKDFSECMFYNRDVISSADSDILNCDVLVLQANERNDMRIINSANYIIDLYGRQ